MSSRCVKEGVTRLYARQCQDMINYQGMSGSAMCASECQSMPRNVGDVNACHIVLRNSKTCQVLWHVKI